MVGGSSVVCISYKKQKIKFISSFLFTFFSLKKTSRHVVIQVSAFTEFIMLSSHYLGRCLIRRSKNKILGRFPIQPTIRHTSTTTQRKKGSVGPFAVPPTPKINESRHIEQHVQTISSSADSVSSDQTKRLENGTVFEPNATAGEVIQANPGLQMFLKRTMMISSVGVVSALVQAQLLGLSGLATHYPISMMVGGTVVALGSVYHLGRKTTANSMSRQLTFGSIFLGLGTLLSPVTIQAYAYDPFIFPAATVLALATTAGSVWYAMRRPHSSLLKYGAPLMGMLSGFVGMGFLSLGSMLMIGPNAFSDIWMNIDMYGGIALFTALNACDLQYAIAMYHSNKEVDPLIVAANFGINYINLFIRFYELLLKRAE